MIEVSGLKFTYPGKKEQTLKGLDFAIGHGEIFGFLGPSGAGKSTTQKILIGILKRYEGQVRVMERELREAKNDYYERIGVAFEFPNFYNRFTALENLKLFRSLYGGETEHPQRLLEMVDLAAYGKTKVSDFSKGMRMRLNFCRALLNRPDLLFLDEPTSGLDPVNARVMKELILAQKAAGKTVLITTHNMQAADEICDRVAFIVDGRISLIDSPRELKVRRGQRQVRIEYRDQQMLRSERYDLSGLGDNAAFLGLLRSKQVETMHTQEATLEDIFMEATGRGLG